MSGRRNGGRSQRRSSLLFSLLGVLTILTGWAVLARFVAASIVLPGPVETLLALWREIREPVFYAHLTGTLARSLLGFAIAFLMGIGWGLASGTSRPGAAVLAPALILIRATPVIAVILLALIWFRSSIAPVFVTWLMVLPIIAENVATGARTASGELREMTDVFHVPRSRRVRELVLPALRPYLLASAHAGLGMAFKVTVAAEVLVQPARALGGAMQEARFYLDTPRILALTLSVIALSAVAELVLRAYERAVPGTVRYGDARTAPRAKGGVSGHDGPTATRRAVPRVRLHGIRRAYGDTEVFSSLSHEFAAPEVVVILGPSGCGKTTLLRLIAGLDQPDGGRLETERSLSFVFQEPRLLPWADVAANIAFVTGPDTPRGVVTDALDRARLRVSPAALPGTLSGGMQQRLALARSFAWGGACLLLDEPFQNLDLSVKMELAGEVRDFTHRNQRLTIMVTHDVVEALRTGDRIVTFAGQPARIIGEEVVPLPETERDPRSHAFQREAARLYDVLLSAR